MVTVATYKDDKYYKKIVKAFSRILSEGTIVEPFAVFIEMNLLRKEDYEDWRFGRIPYLEKSIQSALPKCERILKIIGFRAHDLDMVPRSTIYQKWGKGTKFTLRFSKSGKPSLERLYSKCFKWNKKLPYKDWILAQKAGSSKLESSYETLGSDRG